LSKIRVFCKGPICDFDFDFDIFPNNNGIYTNKKKKIGERRKKENLREEESVGMEAKGLFRGIMDTK
jgi:hypothetical protein